MTSNVDNRPGAGTGGMTPRSFYTAQTAYLCATFIATGITPLNAGGYLGFGGQTVFPTQPTLNIIPNSGTSFNFNIGALPYQSRILRAYTVVGIAEAGMTTPTLSIGTASGGTQIVNAAAAASMTTLGTNTLTLVASAAMYVVAVDSEPIWVNISNSGGAITNGQFDVILEFALTHGPQGQF